MNKYRITWVETRVMDIETDKHMEETMQDFKDGKININNAMSETTKKRFLAIEDVKQGE